MEYLLYSHFIKIMLVYFGESNFISFEFIILLNLNVVLSIPFIRALKPTVFESVCASLYFAVRRVIPTIRQSPSEGPFGTLVNLNMLKRRNSIKFLH